MTRVNQFFFFFLLLLLLLLSADAVAGFSSTFFYCWSFSIGA